MKEKIKNFVQKTGIKQKAVGIATAASAAAMYTVSAGTASTLLGTAISYVATIFFWLGVFFLCVSFVQLMLALKRDDAESQSTQIRNLIIAAVLIGSPVVLNTIAGSMGVSGGLTISTADI